MRDMLTFANQVEAQETQPLPCLARHPFQTYLENHQLSWIAVAREADVPCLIVWSIAHGIAVRGAQAARVRVAVHRLSGVGYTGPMPLDERQTHQQSGRVAPAPAWEARR